MWCWWRIKIKIKQVRLQFATYLFFCWVGVGGFAKAALVVTFYLLQRFRCDVVIAPYDMFMQIQKVCVFAKVFLV